MLISSRARRWINHWSLWHMASATPDPRLPSQPAPHFDCCNKLYCLVTCVRTVLKAVTQKRKSMTLLSHKFNSRVYRYVFTWSRLTTSLAIDFIHRHAATKAMYANTYAEATYNNHRLWPLYSVSQHLQLRTWGFCSCKILLPTCPCWRQPAD